MEYKIISRMKRKAQLGDQAMFFMFIFMMFLVAGGIVIGNLLFIGPEFDFRVSESQLLGAHLDKCIRMGALDDFLKNFANLDNENRLDIIYSKCGLDKEVMETKEVIKICRETNIQDCIATNNYLVSSGDFQPCELNLKNKFLGCYKTTVERMRISYSLLLGSRQTIRRVV